LGGAAAIRGIASAGIAFVSTFTRTVIVEWVASYQPISLSVISVASLSAFSFFSPGHYSTSW